MNLVAISGRLTKDVDLSYTQSGVAKATMTVAVNREFKNEQTGEREADFIQCELWRKQAEFAANNLAKGNRVNIQGSWQTGSYENKQGQRVYTNICNVTSVKPIDWANSEQQQQTTGQQYQQRSQQNSRYQGQQTQQRQPYNQNDPFAQQNKNNFPSVPEEDLPF